MEEAEEPAPEDRTSWPKTSRYRRNVPGILKQQKTCTANKLHYTTKARAIEAAAAVMKQEAGNTLYPYKCPFCRDWHLSHLRHME